VLVGATVVGTTSVVNVSAEQALATKTLATIKLMKRAVIFFEAPNFFHNETVPEEIFRKKQNKQP
jgi:hypothetical protein